MQFTVSVLLIGGTWRFSAIPSLLLALVPSPRSSARPALGCKPTGNPGILLIFLLALLSGLPLYPILGL